ncbi:MAG TPA: hypothetical protein VGF06_07160 [Terriglobales bacterium]|jgi:hypothetical protein
MRSSILLLILSLSTVMLAQTESQPSTPPAPMHHHHMMSMSQGMQKMQTQVNSMRTTLEKMKGNLAKITDPALHQQAQLNVDLWEAMVSHMEQMSEMMHAHGSMGMSGDMKNHPMASEPAPAPEKKTPDQK